MLITSHYIDTETGDLHTVAKISVAGINNFHLATINKEMKVNIDFSYGTSKKSEAGMMMAYLAYSRGWKPARVYKAIDGKIQWEEDDDE